MTSTTPNPISDSEVRELAGRLSSLANTIKYSGDQRDIYSAVSILRAYLALSERVGVMEAQIAATIHVVEQGYSRPIPKGEQCEHDKFGWEDYIACYDEALLAALTSLEKSK